MAVRLSTNEYGTPVSVHTCTACGCEFTLCPPDTEGLMGSECLSESCSSYDPKRDIDRVWEGVRAFVERSTETPVEEQD